MKISIFFKNIDKNNINISGHSQRINIIIKKNKI